MLCCRDAWNVTYDSVSPPPDETGPNKASSLTIANQLISLYRFLSLSLARAHALYDLIGRSCWSLAAEQELSKNRVSACTSVFKSMVESH